MNYTYYNLTTTELEVEANKVKELIIDHLYKNGHITGKVHEDIPEQLLVNEDAAAYYGVIKPFFSKFKSDNSNLDNIIADTSIEIQKILSLHKKVDFWDDDDEQKQAMNEIDDYLYDVVKQDKGIELTIDQMDEIIEKALQVARHRSN